MSDLPFDPSTADPAAGAAGPGAAGPGAGQGQPSDEELRQYLAQMRGAPVEQVLAEVLQGLLNAAQVKLGRRDGRLLLDTATTVVEQVRPHLSGQLTQQVDQALSQLKVAQVEAEKEVSAQPGDEPNDLTEPAGGGPDATDTAGDATSQTGAGQPPPDSPLNKLWIPGQ